MKETKLSVGDIVRLDDSHGIIVASLPISLESFSVFYFDDQKVWKQCAKDLLLVSKVKNFEEIQTVIPPQEDIPSNRK